MIAGTRSSPRLIDSRRGLAPRGLGPQRVQPLGLVGGNRSREHDGRRTLAIAPALALGRAWGRRSDHGWRLGDMPLEIDAHRMVRHHHILGARGGGARDERGDDASLRRTLQPAHRRLMGEHRGKHGAGIISGGGSLGPKGGGDQRRGKQSS